ncbi:hypothetical protein [Aggregatibacter kilianii]|uniref:hypothetical protein n=1 Tax=Aggregatibacter kilianii TaxID=2025884 RepID=UPI000D656C2F|nr:hypothetical protein [Aggregatibacter kilianii]
MTMINRNQTAIPSVPTSVNADVRNFLLAIRNSVVVLQGGGNQNAALDRAVTLREVKEGKLQLAASSVGKAIQELKKNGDDSVKGLGEDPDKTKRIVEAPTAPTQFNVDVGLTTATLTWDYPAYRGHAFTEVYRQATALTADGRPVNGPSFAAANHIRGYAVGSAYTDSVDYYTGYYYWIRHVNEDGAVGPLSSTDGVFVKSSRTIKDELREQNLSYIEPVDKVPSKGTNGQIVYDTVNQRLLSWDGSKFAPLTGSIADGSVGIASFAKNITPVQLVSGVPSSRQASDVVMDTTSGKLYRWDGRGYTAAVNASDVIGQLTAGQIAAGAIGTSQLAAGAITADKLAIGSGVNLLPNPILANRAAGWFTDDGTKGSWVVNREYLTKSPNNWQPKDALPTECVVKMTLTGAGPTNFWCDAAAINVNVTPGEWYMLSGYYRGYQSTCQMLVEKYSENHASYQGLIASTQLAGDVGSGNPSGSFVNGFRNAPRYFVKFRAPDTGCVSIHVRMLSAARSGAHMFFGRPQLEKCSEHATQPGAWSNGGVTEIHGGSIIADTITTGKIAAGVIGARELAAGSITAEKVRAGAITADKMAVSKLSAVSSNLGDITGGSLNINNRFKVASDGTLTMRSSTSNVGMVVTNESIIVYDEAGRVRVRIGKLK